MEKVSHFVKNYRGGKRLDVRIGSFKKITIIRYVKISLLSPFLAFVMEHNKRKFKYRYVE